MTKEEFVERMRYVLAGNDNPDSVKASAEAAVAICEGMGLKFDPPPKAKTRGEQIAETVVGLAGRCGNSYIALSYGIDAPLVCGREANEQTRDHARRILASIIDIAVAQEREACAKVAEAMLTDYEQRLVAEGQTDTRAHCRGIVHQAIRARK